MNAAVRQLTPQQVADLSAQTPDKVLVLDVREPWEYERVHLPGCLHIPMGELPGRLQELDPGQTCVIVCHHGNRSQQVALFLCTRGFRDVCNLAGGLEAWALELDPSLARY